MWDAFESSVTESWPESFDSKSSQGCTGHGIRLTKTTHTHTHTHTHALKHARTTSNKSFLRLPGSLRCLGSQLHRASPRPSGNECERMNDCFQADCFRIAYLRNHL